MCWTCACWKMYINVLGLICSMAGLALQETPVGEILSASAWSDVLLVQPDYPRRMALTSGAFP